MLFDKQNMFSDAQAVTTGTQVSTDKVDTQGGSFIAVTADNLGNTPMKDAGRAPGVDVDVQVVETFTGGTSLRVDLASDDDAALGSPTVLASSAVIAEATLIAGYRFRLSLPAGMAVADKYLGLQFVSVGTHSTGKITAGIVPPGSKQTSPGSMT
ncbi:MAG: hypothetical protein Q8K32_09350 [Archangium sp.]|nr:hypothetical protein [Archangium sp.]